MTTGASEIRWAPRVPKRSIRRLYESEASGLLDEELLDNVGIALLLRAESILTVGRAQRGIVACPRCDNAGRRSGVERRSRRPEEILRCPVCSWETTWAEYRATYRGRQLSIGHIRKPLEIFVGTYRRARTPKAKMLAIDRLIHEFHYNLVHGTLKPTRAACVNLIQGKLTDVVAFLDGLADGDAAAPELERTRAAWKATLSRMPDWHRKKCAPPGRAAAPARAGAKGG